MFEKIIVYQLHFTYCTTPSEISIFIKKGLMWFVLQVEIIDYSYKNQQRLYYHIPFDCFSLQFRECFDRFTRKYNIACFVSQIQQNWQQLFLLDSLPLLRIGEKSIEPYAAAFYNKEELRVDAKIAFRIISFIRSYKISEEGSKTLGEEINHYVQSLHIDPRFESRKQAFISMFSLKEKGIVKYNKDLFLRSIFGHAQIDGSLAFYPTQTTVDIFEAVLSLKSRQTNIYGAAESGKSLSICLLHQLCSFIEAYRENIYRDKQHQYSDSLLQEMAAIPKLFYFPHDQIGNFTFFKQAIIHQMPYQLKTLHTYPQDYLSQVNSYYEKFNIDVLYIMDNCQTCEGDLWGYQGNYSHEKKQRIQKFKDLLSILKQFKVCYFSREQIKIEQHSTFHYMTIFPSLEEKIFLNKTTNTTEVEIMKVIQLIKYEHLKFIKKKQNDQAKRQNLMSTIQSQYDAYLTLRDTAHTYEKCQFFLEQSHIFFRDFFRSQYPLSKTIFDKNMPLKPSNILQGFNIFFGMIRGYKLRLQMHQHPQYRKQMMIIKQSLSAAGIGAYFRF